MIPFYKGGNGDSAALNNLSDATRLTVGPEFRSKFRLNERSSVSQDTMAANCKEAPSFIFVEKTLTHLSLR